MSIGNQANNPNTSQNHFVKLSMNKCRAPKIPTLLVNNLFAEKKQNIYKTIFHNSASLLSIISYYSHLRFSLIRELIM